MTETTSPRFGERGEPIAPQPAPAESGGISLREQLLRPRTLISFAVSIGIIAWVFARQGIPWDEVWQNISRANPWLFALGALSYYSTFLVRTLRWRQVLSNVGYGPGKAVPLPGFATTLRIVFLSWFANSILPAKLGDGYRGFLLKRNAPVSFAKTMGTIIAERVADVGALFALLLAAAVLAFGDRLPENFGVLVLFGASLSLAALLGLAGLRWIGPWLARLLPGRVRPHYRRFEEGILRAYSSRALWIVGLTVLVWGLESLRFWFVSASLGLELSPALVVFVALAASLLTTVPFTPAGLGVVEGAVVAVLVWVSVDKGLAGSVAVLDRSITYWSLVAVGSLVYLFSNNR